MLRADWWIPSRIVIAALAVGMPILSWFLPTLLVAPSDVISEKCAQTREPSRVGRASHVIIVSIDGLRPEAIPAAQAGRLMALIEQGASCSKAETITPSVTLPSHTSMLTGLEFSRHGVVWNTYRSGSIEQQTIFSLCAGAGYSTAMLFSKDKFHYLIVPGSVHWVYGPVRPEVAPPFEDVTQAFGLNRRERGSEESVSLPSGAMLPEPAVGLRRTSARGIAKAFAEEWATRRYHLTFIHFRETDAAGHSGGWMGAEYLQALEKIDEALGIVIDAVRASGVWERTAIIVTSDHGGSGKGHYSPTHSRKPEDVRIPWICVAPGVPAGLRIDRAVRTMDTTPTALMLLGLEPPLGLDGVPVKEVLAGR